VKGLGVEGAELKILSGLGRNRRFDSMGEGTYIFLLSRKRRNCLGTL